MGLFRRTAEVTESRDTISLSQYAGLWAEFSGAVTGRNRAMSHAASAACVDVIAASISSLPVDVVRNVGKYRQPVTPTPPLIVEPSGLVDQDVWFYQLSDSLETDGNAFGEILTYGVGGLPTTIELVDPTAATDRRIIDGVPTVLLDGKRRELYPYGDLWHMPGASTKAGSPFADSRLSRANETISAALAAREFGSRFFTDGGHPSGLFRSETALTREQAEGLKGWFMRATRGNREPIVMGSGITYEPFTVNPDDSQFIDLMQFCIEEACRFWRVPPSMVYAATSGQNITYANVSQADLAYLKHSLQNRLTRIERALTRLLPKPQFVRFNRNAFLATDPISRSEVVDRRLRNKTMSVNEARSNEDEPPFDGAEYDQPGIPGGATPPTGATPTGGTPNA